MKNKSNFIVKAKVFLAALFVSMFTSNCSEVEKNTEPQNSINSAQNMRVAAGSVYLCFDDGPTSNTLTLVNNLKNAGATSTFFIWGNRISSNSAAFNAIKNAGFSIQNHSYTHQHMLNWTYTQVFNDIKQCQTAIQNAGGGTPKYFRPPFLEVNATIKSACSALGLTIVMPTVDTQDWNGASTSSIVSACNNLQNGGNTLMHDGYSTTNAAIGTIVSNLRGRGLTPIKY